MHRVLSDARPFFVIAGPCLVESAAHCVAIASELREVGQRVGVPIIFKASFDKANRRRADAPRGAGLEAGLAALRAVKEATGLAVTTDVHEAWQCAPAAEVCDVLQIPALLCRQTDLLQAAAATGRIVNVKKGQFASAAVMADAAEKVRRAAAAARCGGGGGGGGSGSGGGGGGGGGGGMVMLTERGNSFGYSDLVVDPLNLVRLRGGGGGGGSGGGGGGGGCGGGAAQEVLVVQDCTHAVQHMPAMTTTTADDDSGTTAAQAQLAAATAMATTGCRAHIAPIARMAAAVGVHGFFIETHDRPAEALCDGATALPLHELEPLLLELRDIANASRALR
jgi:2-dehydro-3-deoxyphosphooctonate aldolase (KDO 8-P synthase)